jgi:hypothetical protein
MSKKSRHTSSKPAPARRLPWLALISGGAVLLIIIGMVIWWTSFRVGPAVTPQAGGEPRLAVDRTTVDDGYVKFETPIRVAFKLSNTGSQLLQILSEPQVELIEGC